MNKFIGILLVCFLLFTGFTQKKSPDNKESPFRMEVRVDGNIQRQISESTLKSANTLTDLYERYPAEWMEKYLSVELSVSCNGELLTGIGTGHTLSAEQKEILRLAEYGSQIKMDIRYIPDNSLKVKEEKQVDYTFLVTPERYATYSGGEEKLIDYLERQTTDKIIDADAEVAEWTTVKYTIDINGGVKEVELLKSSADAEVDRIIIDAIKNMPTWNPAKDATGTAVEQSFRFYIGNLNLCAFYGG